MQTQQTEEVGVAGVARDAYVAGIASGIQARIPDLFHISTVSKVSLSTTLPHRALVVDDDRLRMTRHSR